MAKKMKPMEAPMICEDSKWKAESDARILSDAGEVLSDPARLKAATEHLKKKAEGIKSLLDLRKAANKANGGDGEINVEDDTEEMD